MKVGRLRRSEFTPMSFIDKLRTQKLLSFTLILFTLAIGIVIGTLVNTGAKAAKDNTAAPGATPLTIPNPVQVQNSFAAIAKQVEPSVVNISTTYMPKAPTRNRRRAAPQQPDNGDEEDQGDQGQGGQGDQGNMEDFFQRFFSNPFGGNNPQIPQHRTNALGSGVVVDKAGYILTNNHVVDKADRIQVKFMGDTTEYDAKVVGVDAATDLAVIRVEGRSSLTPARIGNSDAVQVGDWAIAIGSPFSFEETMTLGIISAKGRDVEPGQQFQHFIQTDAAINPGNSGGPLLNINGEVVGINTAIASRSGGYQGIGFALPINDAVKVYNDIIKNGKVVRGSIGISFTPSDTPRAEALLKANGAKEGVFVEQVPANGPADKAGIKPEDIIVAVNGKPIRNGGELVDRVTSTPIGNPLTVTVLRERQRMDFQVVVADLAKVFPERFGNGKEEEAGPAEGTQALFGIAIENLTDARRENMGIKQHGVLVGSVEQNSFAEDIDLRKGDVIVEINRQPVHTTDDVTRIQKTLKPGDAVAFRVLRQSGRTEWTPVFPAGALPNHP
ncbi:MAG TPA: Do family serine endopeptidase [Bryobacteraceae bacterium]|nr:Do family serine endopeptidase [Bryobacteraceae bacterium]